MDDGLSLTPLRFFWSALAIALGVFAGIYFGHWMAGAQGTGYLLSIGRLEAENGGIECYFSIRAHVPLADTAGGQAFGLAAHPNGIACIRLRELSGRTGSLFFVPD